MLATTFAFVVAAVNAAGSAVLAWRMYDAQAYLGAERPGEPPPRWSEFHELFGHIPRNTPPDAVIASLVDPMVYLYTGRRGIFPHSQDASRLFYAAAPSIGSPEEVWRIIESGNATHVALLPLGASGQQALFEDIVLKLAAQPRPRLRPVYQTQDGGGRLFEVMSE
jgi:hypothetical protein